MLDILHETKDYIIVNKPSGLITEKNPYENSLESQVYSHIQKEKKNVFLGVVHRLDRVTSGVVLFAKKKSALKYFNAQFESKTIQKTYLAICTGELKKKNARLNHFIEKDQKNKRAVIHVEKNVDSKPCILNYRFLENINEFNLLEVNLQTGRFHQIRAQLSFIGLPIVGDEKYGSKSKYIENYVCLHAWKLSYKDFDSDKSMTIEAQVPQQIIWNEFSI